MHNILWKNHSLFHFYSEILPPFTPLSPHLSHHHLLLKRSEHLPLPRKRSPSSPSPSLGKVWLILQVSTWPSLCKEMHPRPRTPSPTRPGKVTLPYASTVLPLSLFTDYTCHCHVCHYFQPSIGGELCQDISLFITMLSGPTTSPSTAQHSIK